MAHTFTDTIGRKVVSAETADDSGEIMTFVVDESGTQITQVQVGGGNRKPELVDWSAITSFGEDVVLISGTDAVHEAPDDRTDDMVRGKIDFIGSRVLCTEGEEHGTIDDVHFDADTGKIVAVLGEAAGRVPAESIHSLGSYAAVIDHNAI